MRQGAGRGEAGDVRDVVAVECQHEQRERAADLGVRVLDVLGERGLGVGPRRDEAMGVVPSRKRLGVEPLDRFVALVLVRLRGHRQPRVLGQQRDDRFHISALERVGEPPDELAFLG